MGLICLDILINNNQCPVCDNKVDGAFSEHFTYDFHRAELVCNRCGTVVKNHELPSISDLEYQIYLDKSDKEYVPTYADLIDAIINSSKK